MADIEILPAEMLFNIFNYLKGKELIAAALVCKYWRLIAVPILEMMRKALNEVTRFESKLQWGERQISVNFVYPTEKEFIAEKEKYLESLNFLSEVGKTEAEEKLRNFHWRIVNYKVAGPASNAGMPTIYHHYLPASYVLEKDIKKITDEVQNSKSPITTQPTDCKRKRCKPW